MRAIFLGSAALLAGLAVSGCVSTVASVVTAPVKIASKGFDMATTSQSESDEKRGRALRKREEQYGKLERQYRRHTKQCEGGNDDACEDARSDYSEMQDLRSTIPAERD
jgi:hypothetical protein